MLKLAWANKGARDVEEMRQRGKLERKWGERELNHSGFQAFSHVTDDPNGRILRSNIFNPTQW